MDNNLVPDINQRPNIMQTPVAVDKKQRSKKWIIYIILLLVSVGGLVGVYYWQHSKLTKSEQALTKSEQALAVSKSQVKKLQEFQKTYDLPSKKDFSPQCESSNNSELVAASLTPRPIENYQVYLVACIGNDTPVRITAFKVKSDGSRSFAYGASTLEPLCIDKTIGSTNTASLISKQTGVPICKGFQ